MKNREKDRNIDMPSTGSESDRSLRRDEETPSRPSSDRGDRERERDGESSDSSRLPSDPGRL